MRFCARAILSALTILLANLAGASQVMAEDCKPLRLISSMQLESIDDGNRFLVPVRANGTVEKLILDTGGAITSLSRDTVKALGLTPVYSGVRLNDVDGNWAAALVLVDSFDLGILHANKLKLRVTPNPDIGGANGLLSTDLFLQYDVDMDFAAKRLNYFSQDHCSGKVAYWPERPVAIVPVIVANGHLIIAVKLDGQNLNAIIDTGAEVSILSLTAAEGVFGLFPDTPDLQLADTSKSDPLLKFYKHKFSILTFGDISVANPDVYVMTNRSGIEEEKPTLRSAMTDPLNRRGTQQFTLGMDVLKRLHLYIAFGERKLYISLAGSGESALFGKEPPIAAGTPAR